MRLKQEIAVYPEEALVKKFSSIEQTEDAIQLSVGKKVGYEEIISAINLSPETITISARKLDLQGYVTATDLAGSGTTVINGSNISTGYISDQAGKFYLDMTTGQLSMQDGTFSGEVNASSGTIGGFTINADGISGSNIVIQSDGGGIQQYTVLDINNGAFRVLSSGYTYMERGAFTDAYYGARNGYESGKSNQTYVSSYGVTISPIGLLTPWSPTQYGYGGRLFCDEDNSGNAYLTLSYDASITDAFRLRSYYGGLWTDSLYVSSTEVDISVPAASGNKVVVDAPETEIGGDLSVNGNLSVDGPVSGDTVTADSTNVLNIQSGETITAKSVQGVFPAVLANSSKTVRIVVTLPRIVTGRSVSVSSFSGLYLRTATGGAMFYGSNSLANISALPSGVTIAASVSGYNTVNVTITGANAFVTTSGGSTAVTNLQTITAIFSSLVLSFS